MKVYRIQRRSDGLFASGGHYPSWNETGKIFKRLGCIIKLIQDNLEDSKRLNFITHNPLSSFRYEGCDIIEYELKDPKVIERF